MIAPICRSGGLDVSFKVWPQYFAGLATSLNNAKQIGSDSPLASCPL
jgi:hypothetical protein